MKKTNRLLGRDVIVTLLLLFVASAVLLFATFAKKSTGTIRTKNLVQGVHYLYILDDSDNHIYRSTVDSSLYHQVGINTKVNYSIDVLEQLHHVTAYEITP